MATTAPIRSADRPGGLITSVVGSHARPSWVLVALDAAARGELGTADVAELLDDAVEVALRDQESAGIEVVTDGEMRRAGFFTAEFYRHLSGVTVLEPERRVGPGGHDQQHRLAVTEPIGAPSGLGVVAEFTAAAARATRPLKVTLPGPYTLSGRLRVGPGEVYADRIAAAAAFVPLLRDEIRALVDAGVEVIQVDEPSPAIHPDAGADFVALLNAAIEPAVGGARLGAHLCFGNYLGRPLAKRTYRPIRDAMLGFHVDELVLEFANRELAEIELVAELAGSGRDVAVGVVDVKSYYIETAADVADRIERILATGVPAERIALVPDCGFSQTARWATRPKLRALVAGRDLVLGRPATIGTARSATR
jgi:5-methyltetrahydropteroyltriglutamate--homocysteine methyltransferase